MKRIFCLLIVYYRTCVFIDFVSFFRFCRFLFVSTQSPKKYAYNFIFYFVRGDFSNRVILHAPNHFRIYLHMSRVDFIELISFLSDHFIERLLLRMPNNTDLEVYTIYYVVCLCLTKKRFKSTIYNIIICFFSLC